MNEGKYIDINKVMEIVAKYTDLDPDTEGELLLELSDNSMHVNVIETLSLRNLYGTTKGGKKK